MDPTVTTTTSNNTSSSKHLNEKKRRESTKSPEIDVNNIKDSPCTSPMDELERQEGLGEQPNISKFENDRRSSPNRLQSSTYDSSSENLLSSLIAWDWVTIDGLQLPAVTRNNERFVAVHMVQLKLLSKFPSDVPPEIIQKFTMGSHKMTIAEAWTFNSINAVIRKFDLGCQLFSSNDELVKLNDVQMFYWNVKLINLLRIKNQYEQAVQPSENYTQLRATILTLKEQVENDITAVRAELCRREKNHELSSKSQEDSTVHPNQFKKLLVSKNN